MRVDAHQHFWEYRAEAYPWIDASMKALRRDFLPGDLRPLLAERDFAATVAVQARQDLEETEWLLRLSDENDFIKGVVGWVELTSEAAAEQLERFKEHPRFRGVRHVVQDEPDDRFLLREDFQRGLRLLEGLNLTYDILVYPKQLPAVLELLPRFPEQPFVLDHIAKPYIVRGELEPWASQIRELARHPGSSCKLSGMVTEADWAEWKREDFLPYIKVVLEAFGPERLMIGSDWPVSTLAAGYSEVIDLATGFLTELSESEQAAILGENARRFYGLE